MNSRSPRLVMGFGTFDVLHPGHFFYMEELKKMGEKLIIVVARDVNVLKSKGQKALFNEDERLKAVIDSGIPDAVVLGNKYDCLEVIRNHMPQILGFGYDQKVNEMILQKEFPQIILKRTSSYFPEKYKSSIIKSQPPQ